MIFGGHSHSKLEKPKLIEQTNNQSCLICQAGADGKYQIATNNYVAMGNDNYVGFNENNIIEKTKEIDCDVVADYINNLEQPFTYRKEKRIIVNKY